MSKGVRNTGRLAVLAVALWIAGCASAGARRNADPHGVTQPVRIVVQNDNWMDMNVYVQTYSGVRFRIGSVTTGTTRAFTIPSARMGSGAVRLLGDPVGSSEVSATDLLNVQPGSTAYWRIGSRPGTSYAVVR